jgi:1-acyl-sn-glycerol-3-phosphate acyltransferase
MAAQRKLTAERPGSLVHLPRTTPAVEELVDPRQSDVDEWGRSEKMRALARRVYDPLYRYWFRAEWEGFEHLPKTGGALIIANHAGAIPADAPVIMHGIETEMGRPVYGLAEYLFRALPVVGTLWSRTGGVTANPDNAYRLLHDEGQLVLVFPEGTKGTGKHYRDRYQLRRFGRGGFVEIAMRAGVPIVPIAVVGNEESMPILWKSNRLAKLVGIPYFPVTANQLLLGPLGLVTYLPAKFKLRVLPPVHFDVPVDQERYSRSRVMEESERIRALVQDALYDMLRTRRSVWFG